MKGLVDAIYGTLFTWGVTALGAACVLVVPGNRRDILDLSLGFSGGVMLAASYWSLLAPALTLAEDQGWGTGSCVPVGAGILLGAGFVLAADLLLPDTISLVSEDPPKTPEPSQSQTKDSTEPDPSNNSSLRRRNVPNDDREEIINMEKSVKSPDFKKQSRRLLLLILAITVHNFPEGLAVGVGYASVGRRGMDLQQAHNLALGIGLQNFPEGLAVSVPLKAAGVPAFQSFLWGQASGMVEPLAGIIGVVCVTLIEDILAVALSFAAGAMLWVVANDIVPEASSHGNSKLCSGGLVVGFILMMGLDTALG